MRPYFYFINLVLIPLTIMETSKYMPSAFLLFITRGFLVGFLFLRKEVISNYMNLALLPLIIENFPSTTIGLTPIFYSELSLIKVSLTLKGELISNYMNLALLHLII